MVGLDWMMNAQRQRLTFTVAVLSILWMVESQSLLLTAQMNREWYDGEMDDDETMMRALFSFLVDVFSSLETSEISIES